VRQEHHRVAARLFVRLGEHPADHGVQSHHVEEAGGGLRADQTLRLTAAGQAEARSRKGGHVRVRRVLLTPVAVVGVRCDVFLYALSPVVEPDHRDAICLGVRQRPEQHAIEHAEHRRIHADAQRKRDQGNQTEARGVDQHANGMTCVASDGAWHRGSFRRA
jgi:hypothetical protein